MEVHVLYHGNCADGFGAAFAAWLSLGDHPTYKACIYTKEGSGDKRDLEAIPDGSDVYILDFCFAREDLLKHEKRYGSLLLLDHHATAEEKLGDLPFTRFDQSRSGAVLSFQFFHGIHAEIPDLFKYVEDRDLWKWKLPGSKEFSAALNSYPNDFKVWKELLYSKTLVEEGKALLRKTLTDVDRALPRAVAVKIYDKWVPCLNTANNISEIGNTLLKKFPDAPFSATYLIPERASPDEPMTIQWSLRSEGDRMSVKEVAEAHNGGGHRNASGFSEPLSLGIQRICNAQTITPDIFKND